MLSVTRGCAAIVALVGLSFGIAACAAEETFSGGGSNAGANAGGAAGGSLAGAGGSLAGAGGSGAGAGGSAAGAGGPGMSGAGGMSRAGTGGQGGAGGMAMTGTGGRSGSGGAGGMGGSGASGAGGSGGASVPAGDMDALRQSCVDYINMYRATLGRPPLRRGTPEQEACSDMGAQKDGDSGQAHSSAGDCAGLGAQNTCPGYPVRGMGVAGIETSLKGCLDQMWDEGMPPGTIQACISDRTGCFQDHGHWINMQSETSMVVACGFYMMSNGRYWMNQNFGR
jgi:hypothetical protein